MLSPYLDAGGVSDSFVYVHSPAGKRNHYHPELRGALYNDSPACILLHTKPI